MNGKNQITMSQIGDYVGVSTATVGYVLSGKGRVKRISPPTIKKINDAAKELGYVPNLWAKSLVRQKSGVIGTIFAGYELGVAAVYMDGILPTLEKNDYMATSSTHRLNPDRLTKELKLSVLRRDEGLICQPFPGVKDIYADFMLNQNIPLLFMGDVYKDLPDCNFVIWNAESAVRKAIEYLIVTGRRKIAYVGIEQELNEQRSASGRYMAYRMALENAGLEIKDNWIGWEKIHERKSLRYRDTQAKIENVVESLLFSEKEKPDAIFFQHDILAIQSLIRIKKLGFRVPDDIAIVGMGDILLAGDLGASITTIQEPLNEIGEAVAESIMELVENPNREPIQRLIEGCNLKIRSTT